MLGLLKFTIKFTIESWLRSVFKFVINVKDNYSSSGLHEWIFFLLNPMCFFPDIWFKSRKALDK